MLSFHRSPHQLIGTAFKFNAVLGLDSNSSNCLESHNIESANNNPITVNLSFQMKRENPSRIEYQTLFDLLFQEIQC